MAKLNAAESIRGIACLAVVFSHLSLSFYPYLHHFDTSEKPENQWVYLIHHSPFGFWYSGTAAVFVFFCLSGFVLSYSICKSKNIPKKIEIMAIKRYPRLAIPVFLSCIIAWLVKSTEHVDASAVNMWFQDYAHQVIPLKTALYEGTIGSFLFAASDSNWVLWTMQIELFGSFVLFILLFLKNINLTLFFIASVIFPVLAYMKDLTFFYGICSFIIGIYTYLYGKSIRFIWAVPMFLFGLYLAGAHNSSHAYAWIAKYLGGNTYDFCNFLSGFFIVYSVLMSTKMSEILDKKIFVWLGKLSFSIYLLHMVLMYLVCVPVFNFLLNHTALGYDLSVLIAISIFIVVTLLLSDLYSRYVDHFAINVSNRIADLLIKK